MQKDRMEITFYSPIHKKMGIETIIEEVNSRINEAKNLKSQIDENFNLFFLLNVERKETSTHSAFLCELLNPRGVHKKGYTFLDLFLTQLGMVSHLKNKPVFVTQEYYIGQVNLTKKEGGRIDIFLQDSSGKCISIENKIDAELQPFQIERYVNYNPRRQEANEGNSNKVFYLTLTGEDSPTGEMPPAEFKKKYPYSAISYKDDVLEWLRNCLTELEKDTILYSCIKQYIHLIVKLTKQDTRTTMTTEIQKIIMNNYQASRLIRENIEAVEEGKVKDVLILIEGAVQDHFSNIVQTVVNPSWEDIGSNKRGNLEGMSLRFPDWPEGVFILVNGQPSCAKDKTIYGVYAPQIDDSKTYENVKDKLRVHLEGRGFTDTDEFPYYQMLFHLNRNDQLLELFSSEGQNDLEFIKKPVNQIIELAEICKTYLK